LIGEFFGRRICCHIIRKNTSVRAKVSARILHFDTFVEFLDKCEVRENEAKRISPVSKRPYLQNKPPSLQEKTIECGDPSYPNLDSSSNIDISDGKEQNITNGHTDQLSLVSIESNVFATIKPDMYLIEFS
jgi:hypothetical protein